MKVAIACSQNKCSEHFGHCEGFMIFEIIDNKIKGHCYIKNPGHKPGFLPIFLSEKGVNIIMAVGMGEMAQNLFKQKGIEVIVGIRGEPQQLINKLLDNKLSSDGSVCNKHECE